MLSTPWGIAVAIGGIMAILLTVGYAFAGLRKVFFGPMPEHLKDKGDKIKDPPLAMAIPLFLVAGGSIFPGLYPSVIMDMPYGVMPDPLNERVVLNAYHEDVDFGREMTTSQDKVRRVFDNGTFNHYCDSRPGASGGGMTGTGEWKDKIFGILSTQVELREDVKYNISTRITQETFDTIEDWVAYLFSN